MASVRGVVDVRGVLDAGDSLHVEECLVAIHQVQIAVELDTLVFWELSDIFGKWTMGQADDSTEGTRCRVVEQLLYDRIA